MKDATSALVYERNNIPLYILISVVISGFLSLIWRPYFSGDTLALYFMNFALSYCAVFLFLNVRSAKERPGQLLYLIYMTFYYIVPGIFHISFGRFPFFAQKYQSSSVTVAAMVVDIFVISVSLGYQFHRRDGRVLGKISNFRLYIGGWLILIIGLVAMVKMGLGFFLVSRGERALGGGILSPMDNIAATLARQLPFIAAMVGISIMKTTGRRQGLVLSVLAGCIFILLNNPISIPRSLLASYVLAFIIVFKRFDRRVKIITVLILVVAQFSIFPILSALQRGDVGSVMNKSPIEFFIDNGDYDGFQETINVTYYASSTGLKFGHNLVSAILFFVPRDFWPSKSIGTGGEAATYMRWPFINVSSPLPSEFFIDFGYVGVMLGGILFGFAVGIWDQKIEFWRKAGVPVEIMPYACLIAWIFVLLRGSLVGTLGPILAAFAITLALVYMSRVVPRRSAP